MYLLSIRHSEIGKIYFSLHKLCVYSISICNTFEIESAMS